MSRKLALKRLTGSDLTTFEYIYHNQKGNTRQKAINLNSEIFIEQLYPRLPLLLGEDGGHLEISTEIHGPGNDETVHIPSNRTITSKTPKQKNWRLAGNLIPNPVDEPFRYNNLQSDDLVLFEFIGEDIPEKVRFLLISREEKNVFIDLNKLIPGERRTMIALTEEETLLATSNDTVRRFLSDEPGYFFKPKAHILKLLGEELIKSPVMAIYELVKNSYDADSTEAKVQFQNLDDQKKTRIIISDKGTGITEEVLLNVWLEPGTDFRKPVDKEGKRKINRTPIYKRVPMGEKGIGRFAVHKLGDRIHLITRPSKIILDEKGNYKSKEPLDYELEIRIDWRKFSQSKYLNDVPVNWIKKEDNTDFHFKEHSGTRIEISGVKEEWTRGMARQLKRSTLAMLSPRAATNSFKIDLDFANNWLIGLPDTKEVLGQAPYKMTALLDKNYNLTFEYSFEPKNNSDIGKRIIDRDKAYDQNVKGAIRPFMRTFFEEMEYEEELIEQKLEEFDDSQIPFGEVMLELYSYDLDSTSLKDTSTTPAVVKKVLEDHAGIKVFKDDLRVFDYGEPGNDWLGLDLKRVQQKKWFSNNQVIGNVFLNSESSSDLVEKTNREGFVHNYYYELLLKLLDYLLYQFMVERQRDRSVWRAHNKKEVTGSFEHHITQFRSLIQTTDLDNEKKKAKLLSEADKIEKIYQDRQETLLLPAGVGLTASVALHEIDKLIPRMEETVKSKPIHEVALENQIEELKGYMAGILSMLKKGGDDAIEIEEALNQALTNYRLKLKKRKIECTIIIEDGISTLKCDRRYFITIMMNLLDNSIYWIDTVYFDSKEVYIHVFESEKSVHLLVADNGPGFSDDPEELVKPFHSRKEKGIGLGLYIIDTLMVRYGKFKIFTDNSNAPAGKIPDRFSGAIVELVFNK